MIKPDSLRQAIAATVPELARDTERLLMWIDQGKLRSHQTKTFGFEYRYTLNLTILDFAGEPSAVMIAVLAWLRTNQPDLLAVNQDAFDFEADILDNKSVDLALTIELSEQVACIAREDGGFDLQHMTEPNPLFGDDFAPGDITPIPTLNQIWLASGEKLMPDEPPLGADVQP